MNDEFEMMFSAKLSLPNRVTGRSENLNDRVSQFNLVLKRLEADTFN